MSEIENLTRVRPVKSVPAAKGPAAKGPAAKRPAAKGPATKRPAAKGPAAKRPAAKRPAAKERPAKRPVAKEPAAKKPAAKIHKRDKIHNTRAHSRGLAAFIKHIMRPGPVGPYREAADENTWAIDQFEPGLIGTDWTVNEWRIEGPGHTGDPNVTASLRNVHNGKYVPNISTWKLKCYRRIAQDSLDRVEKERKAYAEKMRLEEEERLEKRQRMWEEVEASFQMPVATAAPAGVKKAKKPAAKKRAPTRAPQWWLDMFK